MTLPTNDQRDFTHPFLSSVAMVRFKSRKHSMPGRANTTAPPLLDRQQRDLLEALPPIVTGVDVDPIFESWEASSGRARDSNQEGGAAGGANDAGATDPGHLEAYVPPRGVGLTRLCRRAVILFTRSPACPELVAWQTSPMEQRTYDQMEPLLARAKLSHDDLHPTSVVGFPHRVMQHMHEDYLRN